jgi:DNA topoisomerase-3
MTGDWEHKLREMEQGKLGRPEFMKDIITYTEDIVQRAKGYATELKNKVFPDINAPCPKCGATTLKQTDATYECREPECGFKVTKYIANRLLTEDEARELFTKKFVGPLSGFKSRFNRPFDAGLEIDKKFKVAFVFDRDEEDIEDLTDDMIIGEMTFDDKTLKIYETEKSYYVPEAKNKKAPNGMKIAKVLLQQPISKEDAIKVFQGEKSSLMEDFISNRTKRKFKAFLVYDFNNARPSFEFPPREPKKKAAKKAAKKTAKKKDE